MPFRVPRAGGTRHGRMGHSRYWPSISHDWSLNTPRSHGCRLDWRVWLDGDELSRQERHLAAVAEKVRSRYAYSLTEWFPHYIRHRCWVGRGGAHSSRDRVQALSSTCPLTYSHACAGAGRARGGAGRAAAQAPRPAARACTRSARRTLHAHARRSRALRGGLCVPAEAAAGVLHSCDGSCAGARRLGGRRADAPYHSPRPLVLVLLTTMTQFNGRTTVVSTMSESGNSTSSLSRSGLVRGALPAHKLDPYMRQPTPLGPS